MSASRIMFQRMGGMIEKQMYPAILLQIERRENDVRRLLLSTPTRHYCEHFLPIPSPAEAYDTQWISLVRGLNEAIRMNQRTVHIQMDNEEIVKEILKGELRLDSVNAKYHYLMLMDSIRKTEWSGIRVMN